MGLHPARREGRADQGCRSRARPAGGGPPRSPRDQLRLRPPRRDRVLCREPCDPIRRPRASRSRVTEVVNYGMDGQPISWDEAMRLFEEDRDKRIVEQTMVGDIKVSTVLLVINHNFGDGPPLIFETMI